MANLTPRRIQSINERYKYWFNQCEIAVHEKLSKMDLPLHKTMFQVIDLNGKEIVIWDDLLDEGAKVAFKNPENFSWDDHYMILVSWAAMKITLWERQVR